LKRRGDPLHTNSLVVLDGRFAALVPAFERGNLLLSSRPSSFVCVLDPRRAEIVWLLQGSFREQHDPKLLDDGHLLLFDNGGERRASAVLELDPATGATIWEYRGSPDAPFHSATCGTAERLPNGDTLITESDQGRAFEVTPAGEIVWEFRNPARAGPANEYVATLFELIRLAPIRFDWLDGRDG
jgi:outer membrane protein assembly factor BamB